MLGNRERLPEAADALRTAFHARPRPGADRVLGRVTAAALHARYRPGADRVLDRVTGAAFHARPRPGAAAAHAHAHRGLHAPCVRLTCEEGSWNRKASAAEQPDAVRSAALLWPPLLWPPQCGIVHGGPAAAALPRGARAHRRSLCDPGAARAAHRRRARRGRPASRTVRAGAWRACWPRWGAWMRRAPSARREPPTRLLPAARPAAARPPRLPRLHHFCVQTQHRCRLAALGDQLALGWRSQNVSRAAAPPETATNRVSATGGAQLLGRHAAAVRRAAGGSGRPLAP